uniref:PHD-type domain-containing protein n=1 Tax=Cuerna arida TaxID=1464854 RepID=A0A1B6GIA6_9HEMI
MSYNTRHNKKTEEKKEHRPIHTQAQEPPNNLTNDTNTNNEIYPCTICKININEHDLALACECELNKWYHIQCVNVSEEQYNNIRLDDNYIMTWVCRTCKTLGMPSPKVTHKTKQFDEIIKILMEDISDLTKEIATQKNENLRLSETIAKKTEVIFKLENLIYELTTESPKPSMPKVITETRAKSKNILNIASPIPTERKQEKKKKHNDEIVIDIDKDMEAQPSAAAETKDTGTETSLIIGDSLIKEAVKIINDSGNQQIYTKVIPGSRIQDISKFLTSQLTLPDKVIINAGSNNMPTSKTPNNVMRPLWLTIEALKKKFPHVEWNISSIPYREDCSERFVDETNKALHFMCTELKVKFLNNTSLFNDTHFTWDGIHLTREGSRLLADRLLETLDRNQDNLDTGVKRNLPLDNLSASWQKNI